MIVFIRRIIYLQLRYKTPYESKGKKEIGITFYFETNNTWIWTVPACAAGINHCLLYFQIYLKKRFLKWTLPMNPFHQNRSWQTLFSCLFSIHILPVFLPSPLWYRNCHLLQSMRMSKSHFHHEYGHVRDLERTHLWYLERHHPFQPQPELYLIDPNRLGLEIFLLNIFLVRHI